MLSGSWLVASVQAGPRRAHFIIYGHLLCTGLSTSPRQWLPEDECRTGKGDPWPRCKECELRLERNEASLR